MDQALESVTPSARQRILETALKLFYRDGTRATGIDRIIAESGVAKMSFYRHFPSKSDLICAFLDERHTRWMAWFDGAVQKHAALGGSHLLAVADALHDWFRQTDFRGCAFINTAAEVSDPSSREHGIAAAHKRDLELRLSALAAADGIDDTATAGRLALVVVEGAIVRSQMIASPTPAEDAKVLLGMIRGNLRRR